MQSKRYFIIGGAGFIGSHMVGYLLTKPDTQAVAIYDNFSSGKEWHIEPYLKDHRFKVVRGEVADTGGLALAMGGYDTVVHLASNPDISKAATEPDIDFREGTALTNSVVEAMRLSGVKKILYTSGSGVYGDLGEVEAFEDYGPLITVSTYGASKLAGENLISSYCHMFDMRAVVFRFANVVGPHQTHGIGYDFARKLTSNPKELTILGDGSQSKSYIDVFDVLNAVFTAAEKTDQAFRVYNVATGDYITVKEIADLAVECAGLSGVQYKFTGGNRGWKGDVPIVRLNTDRIKSLGWKPSMGSRDALKKSIQAMLADVKEGRISVK